MLSRTHARIGFPPPIVDTGSLVANGLRRCAQVLRAWRPCRVEPGRLIDQRPSSSHSLREGRRGRVGRASLLGPAQERESESDDDGPQEHSDEAEGRKPS